MGDAGKSDKQPCHRSAMCGRVRVYRGLEHGVIGLETAGALLPQVPIPGHGSDVAPHTVPALCHKDTASTTVHVQTPEKLLALG